MGLWGFPMRPPPLPPSALTRNCWLGCCRALLLLPNAPRTGGLLVLLSALKEWVLLLAQPPPPPPNVPGARCCCPPAHHVAAAAHFSTWGKRMRIVTQCRLIEGSRLPYRVAQVAIAGLVNTLVGSVRG